MNHKETSNELMHFGIPGMRWGVRKDRSSISKRRKKRSADYKVKQARKKSVKNIRTMTNVDIERKIKRLKMEKELKNLIEEDVSPGKKVAKEILSSAGKKTVSAAAAGGMAYGVKAAMTKNFDMKEAANYVAANPNKKK